ncbi:hypothetical protein ES702_00851 [subsurface metagenome]|jgi:hypothetical protein
MKTLFIFIDESGGFDFSPKGTKYFVLSAVSTLNPLGKERLEEIKYDLMKNGNDLECFHAAEDKQSVRDLVYSFIENMKDIEIDSVIVQKNKTNPSLYISEKKKKSKKGTKLYAIALRTLLQYIFYKYDDSAKVDQIVIVLSSIFDLNKRELIKKTIKIYLKQIFSNPFYLYFHQNRSDKNTQIADYCCWAIYRKWTDGEIRPYNAVNKGNKIKSEFDIFKTGKIIYY